MNSLLEWILVALIIVAAIVGLIASLRRRQCKSPCEDCKIANACSSPRKHLHQ